MGVVTACVAGPDDKDETRGELWPFAFTDGVLHGGSMAVPLLPGRGVGQAPVLFGTNLLSGTNLFTMPTNLMAPFFSVAAAW